MLVKNSPTNSVVLYRFGPYEADFSRGELRKFGVRLPLERKPWRLLISLLAHPGEVVTRDELRCALWGEGVFVDFEHGLNVAVKKLRAVLCDSSGKPVYIETVAGEGYRFIANVQVVTSPSAATSPTDGAIDSSLGSATLSSPSAFCKTASEHNAKAEPIQPSTPQDPIAHPIGLPQAPGSSNDSSTWFQRRRAV